MDAPADAIARFRCPECSRGLRVPEVAIGRKIVCPFCRTVYQTSFAAEVAALDAPPNPPETATPLAVVPTNSLARWMPSATSVKSTLSQAASQAASLASSAKDAAGAGLQKAASAASSTAKKAVAAATPLTQVVTGFASVVLPGAGEVMSGKTTQGYCTMAAFVGGTAIATAATGGAWIAAPLAISVFSASQGVMAGRKLGKQMKDAIDASNTEEMDQIARQVREQAASMSEEAFERLMLEKEAEELSLLEAESPKRKVVLVKVGGGGPA